MTATAEAAPAESRRLTIRANVEKLLLLAALTPFVISGIAQRASELGGPDGSAGIVAATVSTGAVCAVVGALGFGWAADRGRDPLGRRWEWLALGVLIGTAGVFVAMIPSLPALIGGWAVAQFGYSGGMALLRTVLARARTSHRRRGSVVMVLGGYLGIFIPVLLLVVLPRSGWAVSGLLACLCLGYALFAAAGERGSRAAARSEAAGAVSAVAGPAVAVPAVPAPAAAAEPAVAARVRHATGAEPRKPRPAERGARIPAPTVLAVQCVSAIVIAAFLSYHPLDLEHRIGASGDAMARASALVLAAAIVGLVVAGLVLFARPAWLGSPRVVLVAAALLLACSIALRAGAGSLGAAVAAAALSGAAVGLNNATLLAAALEAAPAERVAGFIGAFSAAGALGQVLGPLLGLSLVSVAPVRDDRFPFLMLCLAIVPIAWSLLLLVRPRSAVSAGAGSRSERG